MMFSLRHVFGSVLAASLAGVPLAAQATAAGTQRWADSLHTLIAQGTLGAPGALDQAIAIADRVLTVAPGDGVILHYKGYALYRRATALLAAQAAEAEVKAVLEEADQVLEASTRTLRWPETPALRASVTGQLIAVGGMLAGMRLGSKADALMESAVALGPDNPRVLMLRGVSFFFKPRMFGGGSDKALQDLQRAADLFAKDRPVSPAPSWGHAEVYAWLGQVYAGEKRTDDARSAYKRALEIEPEFGWVKHVLLPSLDKSAR
jgi:tetratricopeptide (TPR) repeat protein